MGFVSGWITKFFNSSTYYKQLGFQFHPGDDHDCPPDVLFLLLLFSDSLRP